MIAYRIHIVATQLLFLTYTAQSFVMLTANMEDIKKIARKFVSDSFADKIAEFVVQATDQMTERTPNVSEENDRNENYVENNIFKTAQPRFETTENAEKFKEYKHKARTTPNDLQGDGKIEAKLKYRQKLNNYISHDRSSAEDHNNNKNEIKIKHSLDKAREQYKKYKESMPSKLVKRRPPTLKSKTTEKLSGFNSAELNDDEYEYDRKTKEDEMETTRFRALDTAEITTRKEKTDFDQYDNPKYPRAEYIATSGPVMLLRRPPQKLENKITWQDREVLSENST